MDSSATGASNREKEATRHLWRLWIAAEDAKAVDAIVAAITIALHSLEEDTQLREELASLGIAVGKGAAQVHADSRERTEMVMMIGALIGYAVAKTFPNGPREAADWPDRAIAYARLMRNAQSR